MDCRAVERNLSLFIDGELEPKARLAVEVHLKRCARCQAAQKQLSSIKECLGRTRRQVTAPEDFSIAVQSRLRQLESRTFLVGERSAFKLRRTMMITAVGAALLIAAGLFALLALVRQVQTPNAVQMAGLGSGMSAPGSISSRNPTASFLFVRDVAPPLPADSAIANRSPERKPVTRISF